VAYDILQQAPSRPHHSWQRKILGICWKDKIRNEQIRRRTGREILETIIRRRRHTGLVLLGRVQK